MHECKTTIGEDDDSTWVNCHPKSPKQMDFCEDKSFDKRR